MEGNSEGRFEFALLEGFVGYEPDRWLAGLSVDAVLFGKAGMGNVVGCVDLVSLHKTLAHVF